MRNHDESKIRTPYVDLAGSVPREEEEEGERRGRSTALVNRRER